MIRKAKITDVREIQKLIEALAKDQKDVVVVALSQDSEPKELSEVRKLVEKTLDAKKIMLTGSGTGAATSSNRAERGKM